MAKVLGYSANMGGTELANPLRKILTTPGLPGQQRNVYMLTDGCVSNTSEVTNLIAKERGGTRVHSIGVGQQVSDALILESAQAGDGFSTFIDKEHEIKPKIIELLCKSMCHAARDIKVAIPGSAEVVPGKLTTTALDRPITFLARLAKGTSLESLYGKEV